MKALLFSVAFLGAVVPAYANCDLIRDPDEKAYCRAVSGGNPSSCNLIRSPDRQAYCRAQTGQGGGPSSQCNLIRDRDLRERCRSGA